MHTFKLAAVATATFLLLTGAAQADTQTWTITATTTNAIPHDRGGVPPAVAVGATFHYSFTADDSIPFPTLWSPFEDSFNGSPYVPGAYLNTFYNTNGAQGSAGFALFRGSVEHVFMSYIGLDHQPATLGEAMAGLVAAAGTSAVSSLTMSYSNSDITARIISVSASAVPEPASYALLAGGLLVLAARRRRN